MSGTTATASAEFWEKHYRDADPDWGIRPNAVLTDVVDGLSPAAGSALDLGCGHGGDALWLAAQGWRVTAVDVSATALRRVVSGAETAGVADRVVAARHDLSRSFPDGAYDLVSACYFHSPVDIDRTEVLRRAAQTVTPGGLLLVVDHASIAPWSWNAHGHTRFPTPQETLDGLRLDEGWHIERLVAAPRRATGPDGQTAMVTDNVIALRSVRD
ncbi:class I SAM-dependent methyltransferase [Plantactinospora sp. S1510]|uniref:Class I SAM-dependent methyltransferase n=1 Tax=Plantactinospora alkalitolerans TaxID=2789879 RepID=A0ABS0GTL6_9ACTN|nr:class I SAM-dependent methyltransferase [Plantactinospora alkalitolerans]MBF9129528.1 class I SAM-dependent methyltransferase [Plantactinospora alkalitolerans]